MNHLVKEMEVTLGMLFSSDDATLVCFFRLSIRSFTYPLRRRLSLKQLVGPDTGDLSMRFGVHSGQVTAGVLRGEKSRFQLFGDTVNTGTFVLVACFSSDVGVLIKSALYSASLSVEDGEYRYGWSHPVFRNNKRSTSQGR